jgi:hypothetical protein
MYADDTNLTFASNNNDDIDYKLNQDLDNVNKWLIANKLTPNQSKTEFMVIGSRQKFSTYVTLGPFFSNQWASCPQGFQVALFLSHVPKVKYALYKIYTINIVLNV